MKWEGSFRNFVYPKQDEASWWVYDLKVNNADLL